MSANDNVTSGTDRCTKCWDSIKLETGFASYADYLNSYKTSFRHCEQVASALELERDFRTSDICTLVNLSEGNIARIEMETVAMIQPNQPGRIDTVRVLESLRHPPESAKFRVVLWWTGTSSSGLSRDFLDVCGLGLRLDPRFFEALQDLKRPRSGNYDDVKAIRALHSKYTVLGNQIATIARDYMPENSNAPPILVVAGWGDNGGVNGKGISVVDTMDLFSLPLEETPPFSKSDVPDHPNHKLYRTPSTYRHYTVEAFVAILTKLLEQRSGGANDDDYLQVLTLMPLIYLDALHMQAKSRSLRRGLQLNLDKMDSRDFHNLKLQRFWLRRHVEDSEASINHLLRYCCSQQPDQNLLPDDALREKGLLAVVEIYHDAVNEARALDIEIRDNMQLRTGELSLLETKRSIELSNSQIQEAKRVKIFTILAFVYVPLNTVTSVFGMNVQQINSSGHSIGIFTLTAIVALLFTGMLWYLIEMVNEYKTWKRSTLEYQNSKLPSETWYIRKARFFMLVWLVGNRRMVWAWRAGAWSRIATDSRTRLHKVNKNIGLWNGTDERDSTFEYMIKPFDGSTHSACDYVLKFMHKEQRYKGLDPFALEGKREKVQKEIDVESKYIKAEIRKRKKQSLLAMFRC